MRTLYTFHIDPETLVVHDSTMEVEDDYPEYASQDESEDMGGAGYCSYESDFSGFYAESLVSAEDAKMLAWNKCCELYQIFGNCLDEISRRTY